MDSLYPNINGKFIVGVDEIIMEEEDGNETRFLVDAGRSLLPRNSHVLLLIVELKVIL